MGMAEKSLEGVLDLGIFTNKRVCIDEVLPQNADFLVIGLSSILGLSIFTFRETVDHYRKIANIQDKQLVVKSIYDGGYTESDIIDDVWSATNIYGYRTDGRFQVYRSSTCKKSDWYEYDIIVRVLPLSSGVSADVDGTILIFDRERKYAELRYKILRGKIVYSVR
ncbi:hypothetical protein EROM_031170 [Encephalitozoon romaleae SJ-2008]|uniref:Uncharacterized protein n=1 Tax=Encephalitozoon romaleae (strain SJ-2008) TaxID=1178016 RepID=I7AM36_ENCRO|nr:hypothetical protein EROM_031170 [Encephalitozoon romaleae SJ-2008]AFN82739.1 hypothetical protein EROM_031170 [Encephalitozoon romaleae SJ-2008]